MTATQVQQHYQHYPLVHLLTDKSLAVLRQKTLLKKLMPLPSGIQRILDAGCGASAVMERFNQKYWHRQMVAVDFSSVSLTQAKKLAKAKYYRADITALPFKNNHFDFVISNGVLHHLVDYHLGLQELSRVLKPKGWLYVTLYNPNSFYPFFYRLFQPVHKSHQPWLLTLLTLIYWPVYSLFSLTGLQVLPQFSEARADLMDRFFHPQVSFIPKAVFIQAAKKCKLKLIRCGSHALNTMNSFLFLKYA